MAVCIPNFNQVWKHMEDTCQLPTEVEWRNVSLQVGDIRYCPQIPMLWMQRVSLNTLLSCVSKSCFCLKNASSVKASKETAILLLFISKASYTDIEYIHIRLVMICQGYKVGDQASIVLYALFIQNQLAETHTWAQTRKSSLPHSHSFCLFVEDYESMMVLPTEPPYCLVYPIRFFNDTPADPRNQLHTDLSPPGLCCRKCVCCWLIQQANLHEKWETIMGGSCFLLPCRAKYDNNPLPWLIRPWNHKNLLMDPITAQPYPLVEVGSFTMQDPLFPSIVGDSLLGRCVEVAGGERLQSSEIYRAWPRSTPCHQHPYHHADQQCEQCHYTGWHAATQLHFAPGCNNQWDHCPRPHASTPR